MTAALPGRDEASTKEMEALIPSLSFWALLAQREAAVARLTTIAQAVEEYGEIGEAIWPSDPDGSSYSAAPYKFSDPLDHRPAGSGEHLKSHDWLKYAIACVDASLWDHLLNKSGLRSFMDAQARKEWDEQISECRTPPVTVDNVRASFEQLHRMRGEFVERGVVGVFKGLSWDFKTNQPCKFGKRLIVHCLRDSYGFPTERRADALDDLLRALHLFDGKPEPDHRQGIKSRIYNLDRGLSLSCTADAIEDEYLHIKLYKNGNAHVTFKRLDLIDQLNRILARHFPNALPPKAE